MKYNNDMKWMWNRLKSPAARLLVEQFGQAINNENINGPLYWDFVSGIFWSQSCQYYGKYFHGLVSSRFMIV